MNLTVVAVGTRGDFEPHLALALGLAQRGHRVTLAAPVDFEPRVRAHGVSFYPIRVSFRRIYTTDAGAALLGCDDKPLRFLRALRRVVHPIAEQVIADIRQACRGADAVYYSLLALPACYVAREMGIPSIATSLQPMGRSRLAPSPLYSFRVPLPGGLNLLTHLVMEQLFWQLVRPLIQPRMQTALPVWGHFSQLYRSRSPVLLGYSPSVVPRPSDYAPSLHVTGFWTPPREEGWQPPSSLVQFLSAGPPPVCIGFGSMNTARIDRMMPTLLRAIAETGNRAILLTGWWEPRMAAEALNHGLYVAESVPHAWLFPQVAAVVHHGGAGTVAAALRAGVPSIVAPFFFDQWFWGHRLHRQGLGPPPLSARTPSLDALKRTLQGVVGCSNGVHGRLAALSRQLRAEDGVGNAIAASEAAWSRQGTGTGR